MDREELLGRLNSLSDGAIGSEDSELTNQRASAFDHYYARPYGDEIEGRSAVISRDLAEVVDWAIPELMDVFLASGNIAEFIPRTQEDEAAAEQESDYINHVIMTQNNGWEILHDWFKDALLLKNGYLKTYWKESDKITIEKYEGLTSDEVSILLMKLGDMAEVISQAEYTETIVVSEGMPVEATFYDIELRIRDTKGRVAIECVPPEEIRISKACRGNLNDADYVEHKTRLSRTMLIEMGMDADFVNGLAGSSYDATDEEENARDPIDSESEQYDAIDQSMQYVEYRECYARVDYDDDDKAELRKIIIVGEQIPEGDEWNQEVDHIPFSYLTPKKIPHRHIGESLDDEVADLQEIKTVLLRQFLDNLYGLVNQEYLVNERVNLDDFLVSRPLGVKRIEGLEAVDGSARVIEKPAVLQHVLPAIDYWDGIRGQRTGVKPQMTGLDPDALQNTTKAAYMQNLKQANSKLQFIARMFAEIGVKDLVSKVHMVLRKHQDVQEIVNLRGEYVTVDPREWQERDDLSVKVGLGTGNKEEQKQNAMVIASLQEKLAEAGLVSPQNAYNTFTDIVESMGYLNPSRWVLDPDSQEYAQFQQQMAQRAEQAKQQPNPLAEAEAVKAQASMEIEKLKSQLKIQEIQAKAAQDNNDMQVKVMIESMKEENKKNIAIMQAEVKALIEGYNADIGKEGIGTELG